MSEREPDDPNPSPEALDPMYRSELAEEPDVDEDDDAEEASTVPLTTLGGGFTPWRSMTLKLGEDVVVSFELRPDDDTREMLDRSIYLTMAMLAFSRGLTFDEAEEMIRDWLHVEVR